MRIAINTRFLLADQLEGVGWYTHEIARRMVAAHPEDTFYFFFDRPFDPQFVYAPNVVPLVLKPQARLAPLFWIWFERSVPKALRQHGIDVFFSSDSFCSLSARVPTLMTCHDLVPLHMPEQVQWKHRWFYQKFLPKYLRRADHLLTVSDYVKNDIAQSCGIAPDRISTVYNGCREGFVPLPEDEKTAVRQQFAQGSPYFFYAGAIHPRKNIPRLIRAFDLFKKNTGSTAKLLLSGRFAWKTGEVRSAYDIAEYQGDILMLGYVSEDDLKRLTAAAHALVYPSLSEGFGLPMLEAMHCDTPVVAANATCLPEVAGEAALLFDPLSVQALATALEKIWADPAFARTLVERGRAQREKFSWDRAAETVYQRLAALSAT
jgi:glycosyltransferase involved in cell wall biosynthesis